MKTDKKIKKLSTVILMAFILFAILISSYITAFAVSSAYWSENPLNLYPGETKDFSLTLQNLASTEEVNLKARITESSEIIKIIDSGDIYSVPGGEKTKVNLRASIPDNAEIGDIYPFEITFTTITKTESATFGLGSSIKQGFNVEVIEKPETKEIATEKPEIKISTWIIIAIIVILLIIVVIIILKRRRK